MFPTQVIGSVRFLNLHEYQSISLLSHYKATTQHGFPATTPSEARSVSSSLVSKYGPNIDLIVKAQIHAGGRGKGFFLRSGAKKGVRIVRTVDEVESAAAVMLGDRLVTAQTGAEGQLVSTVLVNVGIDIKKEFYLAILLDRGVGGPVIVVSTEGGMNIEDVAAKNPEKIIQVPIDIAKGITQANCDVVADTLLLPPGSDLRAKCSSNVRALYEMFIKTDATQVEINPLAVASDGDMYCVDAKLNFDDNAAFRQQKIFAMRDTTLEDPRDLQAEKFGLNYIALDGDIGCMVNGAGLAMATMDIIKLNGGSPANFLDVGGGATKEAVTEAFKLLTSDKKVEGLLVNIFGGIMKCDIIAEGILAAYKEVGLKVPLVVRLEGTNVDKGIDILNKSGLPIITAGNLDDAAAKAVKAVKDAKIKNKTATGGKK